MNSAPQASGSGEPQPSPDWSKLAVNNKRIQELNEVEDSIARLLHFAGSTLASLHPEPLATFTDQIIEIEDEEDDDQEEDEDRKERRRKRALKGEKEQQFEKYAEAYYETLNDIQLTLRHSLRHLRLSHATPLPLTTPAYSGTPLTTPGGGNVGVGGGGIIKMPPDEIVAEEEKVVKRSGAGAPERGGRLGVGAMRIELEGWRGLQDAFRDRDSEQDNEMRE